MYIYWFSYENGYRRRRRRQRRTPQYNHYGDISPLKEYRASIVGVLDAHAVIETHRRGTMPGYRPTSTRDQGRDQPEGVIIG